MPVSVRVCACDITCNGLCGVIGDEWVSLAFGILLSSRSLPFLPSLSNDFPEWVAGMRTVTKPTSLLCKLTKSRSMISARPDAGALTLNLFAADDYWSNRF